METNIEITLSPEELKIHKELFGKQLTVLAKQIRKEQASLNEKLEKYYKAKEVLFQTGVTDEQFNANKDWQLL